MRKAARNVKLFFVFRRKLNRNPFPIVRGTLTDVYRDIKNRAAGTPHELCLRVGLLLKMETP